MSPQDVPLLGLVIIWLARTILSCILKGKIWIRASNARQRSDCSPPTSATATRCSPACAPCARTFPAWRRSATSTNSAPRPSPTATERSCSNSRSHAGCYRRTATGSTTSSANSAAVRMGRAHDSGHRAKSTPSRGWGGPWRSPRGMGGQVMRQWGLVVESNLCCSGELWPSVGFPFAKFDAADFAGEGLG
jgi:hypothetical protein